MPQQFHRSAALASLLTFVLPGLGQVMAGARRRGLLIAAPVLLLVLGAAAVWIVDPSLFVRAALSPPALLGIVALSLVVFAYRFWAILDAYVIGRRLGEGHGGWPARAASVVVLVALLAITAFSHGWVAAVGFSAHQTLTAVFTPDGPRGGFGDPDASSATPSPAPTTTANASGTPAPTATPMPTPTPPPEWAADGRLNVLLIGTDAGPGRWSMRADAIILVSVEIDTGRVAAFSLPRYTTRVPLPEPAASAFECRCLVEPINALYVFANGRPDLFPGGEARGLLALSGAIGTLFDVHVDGMAVVDLNGFVRMVDAIGGITVDVPAPVYDPAYPDPDGVTAVEIYFAPGEQRMDGWHALAYARTRHQDGDVSRMQRQQHVIKALQHELSCDLLGRLPAVLEVARDALWTNLPLEDLPEMLRIDPGPVESHSLFDIHNPALTDDDLARIRAAVDDAFDGLAPPDPDPLEC